MVWRIITAWCVIFRGLTSAGRERVVSGECMWGVAATWRVTPHCDVTRCPAHLLTLSLCVSVRSGVQDIVRGEVHGFCILYDGGVINKLSWEVSKILVYFRNNAEKIRINNALVMDDAVSNWIRTLRGESFKIIILLLLKLHINVMMLWFFLFHLHMYLLDLIKPPPVHDYYKCNDINHEKFYKCQFVRDPNSGASLYSHSWFLLLPAFKLIFDPGARLFWALKCHKSFQ